MREILEKLAKGLISVDVAENLLNPLAIAELGKLAKLDVNRELRTGAPEIILAEKKRTSDLKAIIKKMVECNGRAIVSRIDPEVTKLLKREFKEKICEHHVDARILIVRNKPKQRVNNLGTVCVLTGGTSDIPVAEEARVIAEEMGCGILTDYDIGVAGIHRLLPAIQMIAKNKVDVVVVVAGREGALASVVAGLVEVPVVGVPTSVGYGFGRDGISALMAMLQSCSLGIAVVNVDGGVSAGILAAMITKRARR